MISREDWEKLTPSEIIDGLMFWAIGQGGQLSALKIMEFLNGTGIMGRRFREGSRPPPLHPEWMPGADDLPPPPAAAPADEPFAGPTIIVAWPDPTAEELRHPNAWATLTLYRGGAEGQFDVQVGSASVEALATWATQFKSQFMNRYPRYIDAGSVVIDLAPYDHYSLVIQGG